MMGKPRTQLSMAQRRQIKVHIARTPGIKATQVQEWAQANISKSISYSTAKRVLDAPPDAFLGNDHRLKKRRVKFPEFDAAMLSFFMLNDGKAIQADDLLLEEARSLRSAHGIHEDELKLSNGWLHKFKVRHNIRQHVLHGEAASVDAAELAVSRMELKELIGNYSPEDVFNFDESALFYRLPPNKTLATVKRSGKKLVKDRVTVGFCCSMTGTEKMDLVVIGKSKEPRTFRKVNTKLMRFAYYHNDTAWQNRQTFAGWLRKFDAKMHGRRVLLLLDNASCHTVSYKPYNVDVKFLPPNMTAHVQPLDAGIIRSFKARYRRLLVRWLLDALHAKLTRKIDILEAVRFAIAIWEEVPAQVVRNCWLKCDIVDVVVAAAIHQLSEDSSPVEKRVEDELATMMREMSCDIRVDEYVGADSSEPIECAVDVIERDTVSKDTEESSKDEAPMASSDAKKCCIDLRAYLSSHADSDDALRHLEKLTDHVRKRGIASTKQLSIASFFRM